MNGALRTDGPPVAGAEVGTAGGTWMEGSSGSPAGGVELDGVVGHAFPSCGWGAGEPFRCYTGSCSGRPLQPSESPRPSGPPSQLLDRGAGVRHAGRWRRASSPSQETLSQRDRGNPHVVARRTRPDAVRSPPCRRHSHAGADGAVLPEATEPMEAVAASAGRCRLLGEIRAAWAPSSGLTTRTSDATSPSRCFWNSTAAEPELVRRFMEEAHVGGRLQHPGVAPVHDVGRLADERPFFAMKLVEGRTLELLLRSRKAPRKTYCGS